METKNQNGSNEQQNKTLISKISNYITNNKVKTIVLIIIVLFGIMLIRNWDNFKAGWEEGWNSVDITEEDYDLK